jgi:hypothetical protein
MATIRVSCPMCGRLLEVGAEYAGQEVECGGCLQVFVAEAPASARIPAATGVDPPPLARGKPQQPREDHDDWAFQTFPANGTAIAALIVGVLALVTSCCPLTGVTFGIAAMVLGSSAKRFSGPSGAATAAAVLGSVACLISLGFVAWLIAFGVKGGN